VTIPVYGAASLRPTVGFPALIEPLRAAFGEYSRGRAQQVMAALWPGLDVDDGNVLIKAGCITGHDIFVVKTAPWFRSNEVAGRPQGGMVTAFDARTGHPVAIFADEHYLSDIRTAATGALVADLLGPGAVTTAGVLGTGAQAYWQARALAHVRPPRRLLIWGRHPGRAVALAGRRARSPPALSRRSASSMRTDAILGLSPSPAWSGSASRTWSRPRPRWPSCEPRICRLVVMSAGDLPVIEFGFPGPLRDQLVAAVLAGSKTTTTGLVADYEHENEPLPVPGERQVVIDSAGSPVGVVETTAVRVMRLAEVDLDHALGEGEGHASVEEWRAGHEEFWHSAEMREAMEDPAFTVGDDTLVVAQEFRLVHD
jgi:uncharacterized protein YhfF